MSLLYIAIGTFLILGLAVLVAQMVVQRHRRNGRYPAKGEVTLDDVKRLALNGEYLLAIRAHREVSGSSLKDAKAFVEEIKKRPGHID